MRLTQFLTNYFIDGLVNKFTLFIPQKSFYVIACLSNNSQILVRKVQNKKLLFFLLAHTMGL